MKYRIRDIILSLIALLLFTPLIIIIAILLRLTQKRVIFTQKRPGLNEKPFLLLKFSTLYDIKEGEDEAANQQARLTPIGKYLRKLSLDELPQLLNVLKGDMSLIGPRPLLMEYLPLYTNEERIRHSIRPGITGWAQVNGRNKITFKEKFAFDIWYVQNQSFLLDIKILWMTVSKVFKTSDVYSDDHTTAQKFDGTN